MGVRAMSKIFVAFVALHVALLCVHLAIDVCMKWVLIGRRCPGVYPYDESSYCQRWEQYKTKAQMSMDSLGLLGGSWWMVQYYRFLGANVGRDACLYPWGASPGLTEPDLVTLGDRVNVEDVALVAHTNTMGRLELSTIHVGDDCTLRDFSRLQGGAEMSSNTILMEHSLVMSGEVVPEGFQWQGWPNRSQCIVANRSVSAEIP